MHCCINNVGVPSWHISCLAATLLFVCLLLLVIKYFQPREDENFPDRIAEVKALIFYFNQGTKIMLAAQLSTWSHNVFMLVMEVKFGTMFALKFIVNFFKVFVRVILCFCHPNNMHYFGFPVGKACWWLQTIIPQDSWVFRE